MKSKNKKNESKPDLTNQQNSENKKINESNYQVAEGIIQSILDKIIAITIRKSQVGIIEQNYGDFCFDDFKHQLTSLFESNFINYTDDIEHTEKKILWDTEFPKENTWVELPEPGCQEMDRYESYHINYIETKKEEITPKNENNDLKKEEKNVKKDNKIPKRDSIPNTNENLNLVDKELIIENDIIPECSVIEEDNSKNIMSESIANEIKNDVVSENENIINEEKISEKLNIKESSIKNEPLIEQNNKNINNNKSSDNITNTENINKNISPNTNNENNENIIKENINNENINNNENNENINNADENNVNTLTKSKKIPLINFPSYDIPNIFEDYNHDRLAPVNVEFLRREREELIIKKQNEIKIKEAEQKLAKKAEEAEKVKKKLIDTNRLTFDSNGNIIRYRPYKFDNIVRDFLITRNTIKGISTDRTNNINNTQNKKRKNYLSSAKDKKIEEIVIKNNIDDGNNNNNQKNNFFNEKEKEKFIPSGSNFQIISPNTGVVIKENGLFKEGDRDFGKYFNKYSIQNYDKMLNDYVPMQNLTMLKNRIGDMQNSITEVNNSNDTKNLDDNISNTEILNNPLLINNEQSSSFIEKDDKISSNRKSIGGSAINININMNSNNSIPLLSSSNMNSINFKNLESYNSLNLENSIIMKKLGTGSLKLELDSLKDLTDLNPDNAKSSKRYNIFGKNYQKYNKNLKTEKNVFSEFNKKIIKNKGWGNEIITEIKPDKVADSKFVYARHHTKQQVLRELGSSILNGVKIRLPRDRKVDLNTNI